MSESSEPTNKAQGEKNFGPPPEVLVELYDLKLNNEENVEGVWEETARWIKYEEVREFCLFISWIFRMLKESITVGALHMLHFCPFMLWYSLGSVWLKVNHQKSWDKFRIFSGVILLDCNAENFHEVCETIAAAMASEGHDLINTKKIIQVLELKHKYAWFKKKFWLSF